MRKKVLFITTFLMLIFLTGCRSSGPSRASLVGANVYFEETRTNQTEQILVKTETSASLLDMYYNHLVLAEPSTMMPEDFHSDINYTLELQFEKTILSYTLAFDLTNLLGQATNEKGRFSIPYEWASDLLSAYEMPDYFGHLMPPQFSLMMDDYKVSYGMNTEWYLTPINNVSYPINDGIEGYEVIQRDNFDFNLSGTFDYNPPSIVNIRIIDENSGEVTEQNDVALASLPIPEEPGAYFYNIDCLWDQDDKANGQITYMFDLNIELPATFTLSDTTFEPGDCMAVLLSNVDSLDYRVETETFTKTIGLFYFDENPEPISMSNPRDLAGLIPLDSRTTPGDYTLYIYEDSSDILLEQFDYRVVSKEFETQHLTVSSSTASLKSQENYAKDAEKFAGAKDYSVGEALWDGPFIQPVDGRISTEYAVIRYVNGNTKESSRHSGLDIANEQGTPITAAHNGIVTFASDLIVSGNVVVIDHGYGLFTSYVHMHDIYVEKGQEVKQGELIGEVGSTGYSTGPHLHFTVWKNGVYLNPWKFFEEDPLATFRE